MQGSRDVLDNDSRLLKLLDEAIESNSMDRESIIEILKQGKRRVKRFDKIVKQADKQLLEQVYQQEKEFDLRMQNERMLAQQAKHAALGEMMDAVAHQWKQPLNAITMLTDLLILEHRQGSVDEAYLKEYKEDMWAQVDHLLTTLSEFRSFFRPDKEPEAFNLLENINAVLLLVKDELMKYTINVSLTCSDDITINVIKNEFKHILLNILNNAKDAFIENEVASREIKINVTKDDSAVTIEVSDNAGGIPENVLPDIFKANVTSKAEGKGTGIGLYMSKQIADKMSVGLSAQNRGEGALFTLRISHVAYLQEKELS
ncbi:MAG: HAMP domain-containing sensor histidine kinase [Sulfurimonadaceae bacterium]